MTPKPDECWSLTKDFTFEAAHMLPNHDGKCQRLHGHSWKMSVECRGKSLQTRGAKAGMLIDYASIKAATQPLVEEYLDHHYLNKTLELPAPTSEAIAQWVFSRLETLLPGLFSVTIFETCTSSCTYWKDLDNG